MQLFATSAKQALHYSNWMKLQVQSLAMADRYLVITNCTARKRAGTPQVRFGTGWPRSSLGEVARRWRKALAAQPAVLPAGQLYVGRSIAEARSVAKQLQGKLFVVSAGLGLVDAERAVPGYDLSAAGAGSGLSDVLTRHGASVTDWWGALTGGRGFRWLLKREPDAIALLSLPTDYIRLVSEDLRRLAPDEALRLRVFTSEAGRRELARLPGLPVMPYDDRLESLPGLAGTRSDFPQRALRHFTNHLRGHEMPVEVAIHEVQRALSSYEVRRVPERRRLDDDEMCKVIRRGWHACGGNSARLLRYLRDDMLIACEQGRFAELRHRVRREIEASAVLVG